MVDLNDRAHFKANLNVKMPEELLILAHKKAKKSGFTLSQIVRILLIEWVNAEVNPEIKIKL